MKGLSLSLIGLVAFGFIAGSASVRQQPMVAPTPTMPPATMAAWQRRIDAMYARGCFFAGMERDEEGEGAYARFICPAETPVPMATPTGKGI